MTLLDINEFKAVIFDLDSTLMNTHRYPLVASDWLMRHANVDIERDGAQYIRNLVSRYFRSIEEIVEGAPFRSVFEIVRTAMGNSLTDLGYTADPELVEEATQRFKSLHVELSEPYPGVPDILAHIENKGLVIGVVTNSFAGNAEIILENTGLRHHILSVVDCGVIQAYKPMPEPFRKSMSLLDASPQETLLVGDEYYADIVGGKGVNLTTVWVNHREHSLDELVVKYGSENTPDYVTKSITEFAEML